MTIRLLLIDPDIAFIVNIKQALENAGDFRVTLAANGASGLSTLETDPFDIVLLALELPDMDPMEMLRGLRRFQPSVPVIACPMTQTQHERVRYLDAQGAIGKPYSARELIPYVRQVVNRTRTMPPAPAQILEEFEALERAQMRQPEEDQPEPSSPGATRLLLPEDDQPQPAVPGAIQFLPPDDDQPEPASSGATRLLLPDDEQPDPTSPGATKLLLPDDDAPGAPYPPSADDSYSPLLDRLHREPTETRPLPSDSETVDTRQLPDTDQLESLMNEHGWEVRKKAETKPLDPSVIEPPRKHEDTPAVPLQDLDGVRQFLATDHLQEDHSGFGEVLDAVARSQPSDYDRSPADRAFHDLVDSMRPPDDSGRRKRLNDLLASLTSDAGARESGSGEADTTLDYVLDAIRRSPPSEGRTENDLDDATIGDVIDGLFDPAFEGVLAALAGEEVAEEYEEPTYSSSPEAAESLDPAAADDRFTLEEMRPDEDRPDWLTAYEAEGILPEQPQAAPPRLPEPPVGEEDSSRYPATTALSAVADVQDGDDFSLDQLLSQIEEQLPPPRSHRPRLKPLPSWKRETELDAAQEMQKFFDQVEGVRHERPAPHEIAEALSDLGPEAFDLEPPFSDQDTRPSASHWAAPPVEEIGPPQPDEVAMLEGLFEAQTRSAEPELLSMDDLLALADLPPDATQEELRDTVVPVEPEVEPDYPPPVATPEYADETITPEFPGEAAEPDYGAESITLERSGGAAAPDYVEETITLEYPGEAAAPDYADETITLERPGEAAAPDYADETITPEYAGEAAPPTYVEETITPEYPGETAAPDEDHRIPLPVETVAYPTPEESSAADLEQQAAQIAVQLTQYSLESSAQATLLSRPGRRLAAAGHLGDSDLDRLATMVELAWQTGPATSDALIRFVTLPDAGEFLLYSTLVEHDLALSMVFNVNTPVRTIRRQARRLSEALELVPEGYLPAESPAATTRPNRPTDLRPPAGLREAVAPAPADVPQEPPLPARSAEPHMAYTCLWLPYDPGQELAGEFAEALHGWIQDAVQARDWDLHEIDIHTDYVRLSLSVPQKVQPDAVIVDLMRETAQRSQEQYPDQVNGGPLWTDGYYVVSPPRELGEREIARFITYQRQAQLG